MIRNVKLGSVAIEAKESVSSIPSGTPIVGLEHLDPGELTLSKWDVTDKTTFTKTFKKGDVLFGRRRAYLKKAAVAPFDGVCSGDITVIRAMPNKIRPGLLAFLIQNDRFFAHAVKNSDGSLSPRAKWASLKEFAFVLDDDLSVQDRILDMLVSINNTKLEYKKVLAKCDELIKSRFMEMFGDPISNSKQWPTEPLSECCQMNGIKKYPKQDKYWVLNLDRIESGTGAVLAKDYASIDMVGNSTFFFDESYVLYSKLRPYLNKVALPDEPGFATTELVPLKPASYINRTFLATLLRTESFVAWIDSTSSGAKMPRASMDSLRGFKAIIPPITLQNDFANFVNLIDKSKFNLQRAIDKAKKMSAKILNDALSTEE